MPKTYTLEIDGIDLMQIMDGLESRAIAWEKTARYLDGDDLGGELFLIEECGDAVEAAGIAAHYREIIASLESQRAEQREIRPS